MRPSIYDLLASLAYPLNASLLLLLFGVLTIAAGRRKAGAAMAVLALGWSLLWSIPQCSDWLRESLERRHRIVAEDTLPQADAIVILGGGGRYSWLQSDQASPNQLISSRLAAGARAWLAGRAPVIVLSGGKGGRWHSSEAERMAAAIQKLGIPQSALILEERSRNTRDNAVNTARLAEARRIRRVLLVTSAVHMPRACLQFERAGIEVVAVPVPEVARRRNWRDRWLPARSALWRSGRALKEYAGLLALRLI